MAFRLRWTLGARIITGRNSNDIWDEMSVTPQAPSAGPGRTGRHEVGERQEILHAKGGPPAADAEAGLGGHEIRPLDGHGTQAAVGVLEGDAILSPE